MSGIVANKERQQVVVVLRVVDRRAERMAVTDCAEVILRPLLSFPLATV
ncbi:hypothetical protein [Gluconobacter sp. P1D12_c]|nr:hypothetical protein [Gluconobacter sp. P1D12_c]